MSKKVLTNPLHYKLFVMERGKSPFQGAESGDGRIVATQMDMPGCGSRQADHLVHDLVPSYSQHSLCSLVFVVLGL